MEYRYRVGYICIVLVCFQFKNCSSHRLHPTFWSQSFLGNLKLFRELKAFQGTFIFFSKRKLYASWSWPPLTEKRTWKDEESERWKFGFNLPFYIYIDWIRSPPGSEHNEPIIQQCTSVCIERPQIYIYI